ncbi:MAG: hypothetical protein C9356_12975 [Oleiphilus sp.]|nr:MAG: hypothetical protein C9356_12975 [Oleiphilus sp.]
MKATFKKAAIAATIVTGLSAGAAQADTFQALLSIVQPLSLAENTQMDLGQIDVSTDAAVCTVAAAGARSGAACFDAVTNGTAGVIDVSGTTGLQFDISISGTTANGLTFAPSMLDNGQGATTLTGVTLAASHQLTLGGTLTVDSGATASANNPTSIDYDVTVAYQ